MTANDGVVLMDAAFLMLLIVMVSTCAPMLEDDALSELSVILFYVVLNAHTGATDTFTPDTLAHDGDVVSMLNTDGSVILILPDADNASVIVILSMYDVLAFTVDTVMDALPATVLAVAVRVPVPYCFLYPFLYRVRMKLDVG